MTSYTRQGLELDWSVLEAEGQRISEPRSWYTYATQLEVNGADVLLACDADGRRHLLVPTKEENPSEDKASKGIQILTTTLEGPEGALLRFVDIKCQDASHNELFSTLSKDILDKLQADEQSPSKRCISILNEWRDLFGRQFRALLGLDELAALFGELHILELLSGRSRDPLSFWSGPQKAKHDFESNAAAIEVKTSRQRSGRFITINGIDQLVPPVQSPLYLCFIKIEATRESGVSVPDLISRLLNAGIDRYSLEDALACCNFRFRDMEHYRRILFRILEIRWYHVDDSFPALTPSSLVDSQLDARIQRVSYTIDMSGEPPSPLDSPAVEAILNAVVSAK